MRALWLTFCRLQRSRERKWVSTVRVPVDVIGVHWASLGGDWAFPDNLSWDELGVLVDRSQERHTHTDGVCEWGGNQLFRRNKSSAKTHHTVWQSPSPHRSIVFIFNYALPWSIIFLFSLSVEQAKSNPTLLAGAVYPGLRREIDLTRGHWGNVIFFSADIFLKSQIKSYSSFDLEGWLHNNSIFRHVILQHLQ